MEDNAELRYSLTSLVANQFMLLNEESPEDYIYTDFIDHFLEKENIVIDNGFNFVDPENFLGATVKNSKRTKIFINPKLNKKRYNFSLCHEVIHCLFDISIQKKTQAFFTSEGQPSYYDDDQIEVERLANLGAGVLMLPDIKILKYLDTMRSFPGIADDCGMSQAALFHRLVAFGTFKCGMSYNTSVGLVNDWRYKGKRDLYRMWLFGHGTKGKQIIEDYENAVNKKPVR